jgi:Rhodopirellula transposase DDE domain
MRWGWGGIAGVARATGLAISTVTLGRREVRDGAQPDDVVKVRRKGGGRRRLEEVHPNLVPALERLVDPATRGDPESPLRWTNKSTYALSAEMFSRYGIPRGRQDRGPITTQNRVQSPGTEQNRGG